MVRAAWWQAPLLEVTIEQDLDHPERTGSTVRSRKPLADCTPDQLFMEICISAAGQAAEYRFRCGGRRTPAPATVEDILYNARGDNLNIREAMKLLPSDQHGQVVEGMCREVDDWIERPEVWRVVRRVATALVKHSTLSGDLLSRVLLAACPLSGPRLASVLCTTADLP